MLRSGSHAESLELARTAAASHSKISWVASACAFVLMLAALGGLTGCASGSSGLPPALPIPNPGGLVFTTLVLANGVAGRTYTYDFVFTGGTAPYTCVLQAPGPLTGASAMATTDPAGGNACQVAGMAAGAGSGTVMVQVTDSGRPSPQTAFSSLPLTINPALSVTLPALANGVDGRNYTQNVSAPITGGTEVASAGAPYTCMVGGLPALGLSSSAPAATTAACTFTISNTAMGSVTTGMDTVTATATDTQLVEAFPSGAVIPVAAGAAVPAGDLLVVPSGTSAPSGAANNLTVRPEFAFVTPLPAAFPDGVVGRTYGIAPLTAPTLMTTVSATVGNMPLTACGFTAGTNLMTNPLGETVSAPASCALSTTAANKLSTATAPGSLSLTVTATDTPIPDPNNPAACSMASPYTGCVVPANTIPATAAVALTVHPPLALTLDAASAPVNPAPVGVQGRSYGNTGAGFQDLAFDAAGGLTPYIFGLPGSVGAPAADGVPAAVACAPNGADTIAMCTSGASTITANAGAYPFSITLNDTGNTATPSASVSGTQPAAIPGSITVNAALALTVDAASAGVNPAPPGVMGRSYGNTMAGFKDLAFDATGGTPSAATGYTFTLPASVGAPAANGVPSAVACSPNAAGTIAMCTSGASTVTANAGAYPFSISVNDTANATTPNASASGTQPAAIPGSITINSPLALAIDAASAAVNPAPAGVQGRSYGNTMAGFQELAFDASLGLPPYIFGLPASVGSPAANGVPSAVACAPNGADTIAMCTGGTSTITANAGAYPFSISLNDTANATTPSAAASGTQPAAIPGSITVNSPLALTVDAASAPVNPAPPGVQGRSYGNTMAGFKDLAFDAAGGLPAYIFGLPGSVGAPAANGVPSAVACAPNGADTIAMCTSGTSTVTANTGTYPFSITLNDTANATTPSASASGTQPAAIPGSITINGPLAWSIDAAGVDPPTPGVINRTYGNIMAGFMALVYDASGGLGTASYVTPLPPTVGSPAANGVPSPVACGAAIMAGTYKVTCTGGTSVIGATAGAYPFQILLNDTANATTPNGGASATTATFSSSITIRSQLAISSPSPNPVTNAVTGRGYGVAAGGSQDLTYSVAAGEGLPTVTIMGSGFPSPIACTTQMNAADSTLTMPCNSGGVGVSGSTATGTVTVSDTANATTPAATTTSDPGSQRTDQIKVVPELTIGNLFVENATVGEPYSAIFYSNNGGIPSSTAPVPPAYTWSTTAGGIAGVTFGTPSPLPADDLTQERGYYVGTPTTASTPTVSTTFTVTDSSNPTTPNCSTAGTCPTFTTTNKVLPEDGFVATYASGAGEQGDTVVSFDSNAFSAINFISLNTDAAFDANPVVARVSPDGEWVYVPKQGNTHDVSVIDSISTVTGCTPAATCATNDLAVQSIVVSNTATFNPSAIDIENQKFFSAPFACGTAPCSVQRNFRYDAWLVDPTDGNQTAAIVEPIPDAENPGTVTTPLTGTNTVTVADADNIAISPDTTLAFVSVNYLPSGTACGSLPTNCATLTPLNLPATPITASPTTGTTQNTLGLRAGAVAADPRGNNDYTATRSQDATIAYIAVTTSSATPSFVSYIPPTAGVGTQPTTNVCSSAGTTYTPVAAIPTAVTVSPDGNRLFLSCLDTATPQVNNTVGVWNVSDTGAGISFVQSISLPASSGSATNAENGCTTPVDIKARLTTSTTYGTRLFVSCQDSDTIVPIDYNTGSGSTTVDSNAVDSPVSTDATAITNASIGNTTPAYTNYACGNTGSCPQLLDLMPNPPLHFTSGGYAPTLPAALPKATSGQPYSGFVVVAGGTVVDSTGTVKRTWSNPDGVLASDPNCAGLSLNSATGEISGTPTAASGSTCGGATGFTIRVTDASVTAATPAGQFVERTFTIAVH